MSSVRRWTRGRDDDGLSNWTRRRVLSWTLFSLAALVVVQHVLAHGGFRPTPLSMGWQDILIGYPTAIALAVLGAIALDPNPRV